ncbi:methyl-accepting chemotaxis protein [Asticcacaulis sp.]|uniref:methyl-accepting chemotaxis protein n=1 Tax=Asticcacaulis sp. TaxID=1872648 RepID=UPI0026215084|nr:methyl-accepting chemotaxis protein [Asticcacaulis sp.]
MLERLGIRLGVGWRDGLIAGGALFAAAAVTGLAVYLTASSALKNEVRTNLMRVAVSAAQLTDITAHARITRPEDQGNADYEHVRAPYFALLRGNPDLAYIYTMVRVDGKTHFIMDASIPKPGEAVVPTGVMETYENSTPVLEKAFETQAPQVEADTYTDKWGTFLSGYAPLVDKGRFVGLVGVDIRVDAYLKRLEGIRNALLTGLGVAALAAIAAGLIVGRHRHAAERVRQENAARSQQLQAMEHDRLRAEHEALQAEASRRAAMSDAAAAFEQTACRILDRVKQSVGGLHERAADVSEIAIRTREGVETAATATRNTQERARHVSEAAQALSLAIRDIAERSARSDAIAHEAAHRSADAAAKLDSLSARSAQITDIISLIDDVASQINLLALNATIESARAGDAGKGFAVVASEVKILSGRVAEATRRITTQIQDIQSATRETVDSVGAIRSIIEDMGRTAQDVAQAVEAQTGLTARIGETIEQTAADAQAVGRTLQQVHRSADETDQTAACVSEESAHLAEETARLNGAVDSFLRAVRAA